MQRWVVALGFLALLPCALIAQEECPDRGHCKDGQTCCQHPSNGYQCCPFNQAECCEDHMHCCPAWMSCDVENSRCVNASLSVPWAERTPTEQPRASKSFRMIKSHKGNDDDNICPDQSRCPAEYSCLRALTKYGCCPLSQGTPCSDGKHCCPQGHSCSEDSRSCIKKEVASTVMCSDGVSECPEESSCCEGADGGFGCCPMSQAVCCDDKIHCCPEGSLCDLETSKCVSTSSKKLLPMWAKFPSRKRAKWEDQKEEQHVIAEAAASSEHHEGKVEELPAKAESVVNPAERATDVECDRKFSCPDDTTCCAAGDEGWGCCPDRDAVCCSDHEHCCPHGTECDVAEMKCLNSSDSQTTPMTPRTAALITTTAPSTTAEQVSNAECTCTDIETCCSDGEGGWGCCPLPNAVCCSDHAHCCEHGTECDVAHMKCVNHSDSQTTPMAPRTSAFTIPATPVAEEMQISLTKPVQSEQAEIEEDEDEDDDDDDEDVEGRVCCRGHRNFTCPRNSTCCRSRCRGFRCCPMPNAKCCGRGKGCCPHGHKCCHKKQTCVKDGVEIPWFSKIPALPSPEAVYVETQVKTPGQTESESESSEQTEIEEDEDDDDIDDDDNDDDDDDEDNDDDSNDNEVDEYDDGVEGRVGCGCHNCSSNSTCCHSKCHKPYCCPLPKAHCCRHGEGCCPHGYSCCHEKKKCVKDGVEIPWYTKVPAQPIPKPVSEGIQANKAAQTDPDQTELTESENEEEEDKIYDLFNDYIEDNEDYDDEDEDDVEDTDDKVHCNSTTSCSGKSTCCKSGDDWNCCPHKNGVCCPESKHCCPPRSKCVESGCERDHEVSIPWFNKLPTLSDPEVEVQTVDCPGGGHCPDQMTCCLMSSGEYGCCPMEKAVCCDDKIHCCPNGYTCDSSTGQCTKSVVLEMEMVPLTPVQSTPNCGTLTCVFKCCNVGGVNFCCPFSNDVCCPNTNCCSYNQRCAQYGGCISNSLNPWENWPFFKRDKKNPGIM